MEKRVKGTRAGTVKVVFSLRSKIILTFLVVGSIVSGLLSYGVYRILDAGLLRQMQGRVLDLARLGTRVVDVEALARLKAGIGDKLPDDAVDRAESSADFRAVSEGLNRVREVEPRLVHFIYTFFPTADSATATYIVDADVLADRARKAAGETVKEDISHYSSPFDVSDYPVARQAMAGKAAMVENAWSYDPNFKVNSISGYAPLFSRNGEFVGMLGIDMVDADVRLILSNASRVTLMVIAAALALTVASSIVLGTLFTRGIIRLDRVVRTFDKDNLAVRAPVGSRDEVGRLSSSFNEMAETIQEYSARQEALLKAYGRFVPHELLRLLDRGSILDVKLGDQTQRDMTVLFSDIRSFTRLSESMTPVENFKFINSYLERMGPEIRENHGIIDKYIGDAIMALFPVCPDDAIASAVSMQWKLLEYNQHRAKSGYPPISVGIGVNAGTLMLGTVGEHERMDGSVISDAVNLCSRLETLTRVYGSYILTTGKTLKALTSKGRFTFRFVDRVRVRGRREVVLVFEVLDGERQDQRDLRLSYRAELAHAQRMYFARQFKESLEIFTDLKGRNPGDHVIEIYRARSEHLVRAGVPETWEAVEEIETR
jgi:class 3 adenylate cyclase/HAMP domain-containing protein